MERWQHAVVQGTDDRGRAKLLVDPDPDNGWPDPHTSIMVRIRRPRNPKHHRLYWGMLRQVVDATDQWPTPDALHKWIKYELSMYTMTAVDEEGLVVIEWESTDFMSMDQADFREFFDRTVACICIETGIDPLSFTEEGNEYA